MSSSTASQPPQHQENDKQGKRRLIFREDVFIFIVCALPFHIWSYFTTLREVPGWLYRLDIWDVISSFSLMLTYTLVETILVIVPIVALSHLISEKNWRGKRKPIVIGSIYLTALLAVIVHFQYRNLRELDTVILLAVATLSLVLLIAGLVLIWTLSAKIGSTLNQLGERLFVHFCRLFRCGFGGERTCGDSFDWLTL